MINFKNIKSLLLAGVMASTVISCTNLDEEVFDQVVAENFYQTPEEFDAAVASAYTSLYGYAGHNGIWSIQEVSGDALAITQKGGDWFDGGQWIRMHRHTFNDKEEAFNNTWNFLYTLVSNSNLLLEQFAEVPDSPDKARTVAELRTLRALGYYWLMDLFGNVPIVTSFSAAEDEPSNDSRATVYAFVETEITESLPDLPAERIYSKVTQGVAQAILAKLYINHAVYLGSESDATYQKAIDAVDAIDALGHWSLASDFFSNLVAENQGSTENIFVIPYDEVFAQGFNLPQMTLHYGSQETYNLVEQPWNGYVTLQEFYESYEANDIRRTAILTGPQFKSDGVTPVVDASAEEADPDGPELNFTVEVNELEPNALRQAGGRIAKFPYELGATSSLNNDFPIFRYADMLLIKAEALWRISGNPTDGTALALVNDIRDRAGVDPITTLDGALSFDLAGGSVPGGELLNERGREMYAESTRRQDLIRFGVFTTKNWWEKTNNEAFRILFPIPDPQRLANANLEQNPGY